MTWLTEYFPFGRDPITLDVNGNAFLVLLIGVLLVIALARGEHRR